MNRGKPSNGKSATRAAMWIRSVERSRSANKPCGGPERWLAWSTIATDESDLHRRIDQYTVAQAQVQRAPGLVSNCAIVPDPGATCRAGHCVLQAPGSLR
jgi:hypothetical protein